MVNIYKNINIPNRPGGTCIYCDQDATDRDHVVARNLFPDKGKGLSLMTVPSCHKCNVGLSNDEEFFRTFISGLSLDWSNKAKIVFDTQVRRQIKRKPSLGWQQFNKMKMVDITTPAGIYTGKKATAQHVPTEDWDRCFRVVEKTVKGLVYTIQGNLIDDSLAMKTMLGWNDTIKQFLPFLQYHEPADYSGIFSYAFAVANDSPFASVWFTQYYDRITFCTWINKKGSFPEIKASSKTQILNLLPKD